VHVILYQKNARRHTYIYSTPVAAIPTSTQRLSRHTYIYSMPVLPHLHLLNACLNLLNACPAIPTSTQRLLPPSQKKRRECFPIHEIGRIHGGRGFQTGRNVFRIGGNTFYVRKNKIPMKIPEFKRSRIGIIAECRGVPSRFPNQDYLEKLYRTLGYLFSLGVPRPSI
jgi:hypothetical protein